MKDTYHERNTAKNKDFILFQMFKVLEKMFLAVKVFPQWEDQHRETYFQFHEEEVEEDWWKRTQTSN